MPMPVGGRLGRASRFLLEYDYRDGLDKNGLPVARSGQITNFGRGGTINAATAIDRNGRSYKPGPVQPRFYHQYNASTGLWESQGLWMEGTRQNLAVQSEALATAPWSGGGGTTATNGVGTYAGLSFSRVSSVPTGQIIQTVAFTGNGVKSFTWHIKQDGANAGTFNIAMLDSTASVIRLYLTLTVSAAGVVTVSSTTTGVLVDMVAMADGVYRVRATSTSVTAANTNILYATASGGTLTSVLLAGMQPENAAFPSSYMPTGASTVTRSGETCWWALNAPPQEMTVLVDGTALAPSAASGSATWWEMGNGPYLIDYQYTTGLEADHYNGAAPVSSSGAATIAMGDRLTQLVTLSRAGVVQLGYMKNGAAPVTLGASASNPLAGAWGLQKFFLGSFADTTSPGFLACRAARVSAGIQGWDNMLSGL